MQMTFGRSGFNTVGSETVSIHTVREEKADFSDVKSLCSLHWSWKIRFIELQLACVVMG